MRATTKTTLASKVASSKTATPTKTTHHPKSNGSAKVAAPVTKATTPSKKSAGAKSASSQPVAAPPAWTFPTVPNGFVPPSVAVVRSRSKPTEQMRDEAEDFAAELRSGTTYSEDFGKRAPDPIALADLIEIASEWDAIYDAVAPVAEYALAMRGGAWDAALKPVKKLQTAYEAAVTDEPSLTKTWRQMTAFFGARDQPAQQGVKTRKAKKNAAKKAAKAQSAANGQSAGAAKS
jgi:hypothetical protein